MHKQVGMVCGGVDPLAEEGGHKPSPRMVGLVRDAVGAGSTARGCKHEGNQSFPIRIGGEIDREAPASEPVAGEEAPAAFRPGGAVAQILARLPKRI